MDVEIPIRVQNTMQSCSYLHAAEKQLIAESSL